MIGYLAEIFDHTHTNWTFTDADCLYYTTERCKRSHLAKSTTVKSCNISDCILQVRLYNKLVAIGYPEFMQRLLRFSGDIPITEH